MAYTQLKRGLDMPDTSSRRALALARFTKELDLMFCDLRRAIAADSLEYIDKVTRAYGETDASREVRALFQETLVSPMAPLPAFDDDESESFVLPSDEPAAAVRIDAGVAGIPNSAPVAELA